MIRFMDGRKGWSVFKPAPGRIAFLGSVLTLSLMSGCSVWTGSAFEDRDLIRENRVVENPTFESAPRVGISSTANHPAVKEYTPVILPTEHYEPSRDYRVGPNDILFISVKNQADLSSLFAAPGAKPIGSRVDGQGHIQLPLIGSFRVQGMTVSQIQQELTQVYAQYIQNPWLVVEILEYRSQPVYLLGEFRNPTTYYMDRPIRLAQALTMGNGYNEKADLRGARVLRDGKVVAVDIYRLLYEGDTSQNTWLKPNDTLFIPSNSEQRVIVLGDVSRPGPVLMKHGQLTLTEAFAAAGDTKRIGTSLQYVRVIRSLSPTRGELIVVDYYQILRGQAMDFPLMSGDIVIVPRTGLGKWNDMIQEVIPSLRLVSALLQPFALIRVMVDDDNNN